MHIQTQIAVQIQMHVQTHIAAQMQMHMQTCVPSCTNDCRVVVSSEAPLCVFLQADKHTDMYRPLQMLFPVFAFATSAAGAAQVLYAEVSDGNGFNGYNGG